MTRYRVVFSSNARAQLAELHLYIADAASPSVATRYTDEVITYCESLTTFPYRGARRDDLRPGLRITHYKKRTVIVFDVDDDLVSILGIFHGGQNYEAILHTDDND